MAVVPRRREDGGRAQGPAPRRRCAGRRGAARWWPVTCAHTLLDCALVLAQSMDGEPRNVSEFHLSLLERPKTKFLVLHTHIGQSEVARLDHLPTPSPTITTRFVAPMAPITSSRRIGLPHFANSPREERGGAVGVAGAASLAVATGG